MKLSSHLYGDVSCGVSARGRGGMFGYGAAKRAGNKSVKRAVPLRCSISWLAPDAFVAHYYTGGNRTGAFPPNEFLMPAVMYVARRG